VKKLIFMGIVVAVLTILPTSAQAVPIAGDLSISGTVRVTTTMIDWLPIDSSGNEFIVLPDPDPVLGDYFTFLNLSFGDAADLSISAQPPGPGGFPGGPLPNFLTFDGDTGLSFTLNTIAACDPGTCFFPGTPFSAFQTLNETTGIYDTTVQMAMTGTVRDTTGPNGTGEISNWAGSWTATFQGQTIAELQTQLATTGEIPAGYDAELNVSIRQISEVPEPATLLTFGTGTALLAAHRRRRAKNSAQVV